MRDEVFFKFKYLFSGGGGKFSKRAFFFTLFGVLAALYIIGSAFGFFWYNDELGIFILGCNAAFGLNYYVNEKGGPAPFVIKKKPKKGAANFEENPDGPQ